MTWNFYHIAYECFVASLHFKKEGNMKSLVIGASEKTERYSNKAIHALRKHQHEVVAIGSRKGQVLDVTFDREKKPFEAVDTVTMYIGPTHQEEYYDYVLSLKPRRIIFNPGTENDTFVQLAEQQGIRCQEACTLVLLSTGQY